MAEATSVYYENLIKRVLEHSVSNEWSIAVSEWKMIDVEEDSWCESQCVCGKENIRYLFTIKNIYNNNKINPIGSRCIKRFNVKELSELVSLKESLFKLLHAVEENKFIEFSSELFSRKLLKHLYDLGAFMATEYNDYEPYNDYEFLLKMFNKSEAKRTEKQKKKAIAIVLSSIKPFLKAELKQKKEGGVTNG